MGDIAISVEHLGKRYRIGQAEQRPQNLREAVSAYARSPFRYLRSRLREPGEDEMIWALKDVSFEVKHGEVLGIIGRNGAGKSTLLKILSRITEPTEGCAKVYGRVGSLLEVGTGFHPELTGRENIYLNGAILGMKRAEIDKKFDEIVDFSGIEKFLDTPVKRYSSGMYVRLAFAVAAHLEPEILLVDEVLAVGDIEFQKRCLGKMGEISKQGRTVLFVSHNMGAIMQLTSRGILVNSGRLEADDATDRILDQYLHVETSPNAHCRDLSHVMREGTSLGKRWKFTYIAMRNATHVLSYNQPIDIELHYLSMDRVEQIVVGIGISNLFGTRLITCRSDLMLNTTKDETGKITACIKTPYLAPGTYLLQVGATVNYESFDYLSDALVFEISPEGIKDTWFFLNRRNSGLLFPSSWKMVTN